LNTCRGTAHWPVDLVVDSAIRNRYFRQSVDQTKTLLYAA
jgi:hypothetical protein